MGHNVKKTVIGATALAAGALAAHAATPSRDSTSPTPPTGGLAIGQDTPAYAIGDRLKITFFETVGAGPTGGSLGTLIERTELSGEYVVQQDGSVFLPLVGSLTVVGQTLTQIEEALMAEYSRRWNGGQIKASIQVLEREPIYVSGPVPKPGTYKFVPGMTVIHALTLAGGEAASSDQWKLLDATRERERLSKSTERLKRLQAKVEVLRSERDGRAPAVSNQLNELVGRAGAQELMTAESRLRTLERERRGLQLLALEKTAAQSRAELVILRERLQNLENGMREKAERMQEIVALRGRGVTTDTNFHMTRTELTESRNRWHEARLAVSQTERRLDDVAQDKARLNVEVMIEREREIKDLQQAIAEEEITRATIGHLLTTAAYASTEQPPDGKMSYWILRRGSSGLRRLPAEDVTVLEPGDVVLVTTTRPEMAGARPNARAELHDRVPN
jgi:polysaccharide biosynthesis/export protein ExoF